MRMKVRKKIMFLQIACLVLAVWGIPSFVFIVQIGPERQKLISRISNLESHIAGLRQSQGEPLPATSLPDGLYTTRDTFIFAFSKVEGTTARRCYWTLPTEQERSIWSEKDGIRIMKDLETRDKERGSDEAGFIIKSQFDAIDQRVVKVAEKLNFNDDVTIIVAAKGDVREYTVYKSVH